MSKNILFLALSFLEVSEGTEGTYREWTVEVGRKQLQRLLSELHLTSHHLPRLSLPSFLRPMCLESSQCPLDLLSVLWCPRALQLSSAQHALIHARLHMGAPSPVHGFGGPLPAQPSTFSPCPSDAGAPWRGGAPVFTSVTAPVAPWQDVLLEERFLNI